MQETFLMLGGEGQPSMVVTADGPQEAKTQYDNMLASMKRPPNPNVGVTRLMPNQVILIDQPSQQLVLVSRPEPPVPPKRPLRRRLEPLPLDPALTPI